MIPAVGFLAIGVLLKKCSVEIMLLLGASRFSSIFLLGVLLKKCVHCLDLFGVEKCSLLGVEKLFTAWICLE